ncbi:MAG: hypothetical protein AB7O73_05475 [Bacteroidia bacterium]
MKKLIVLSAIGLAILSCKKDRVCSCKDYTEVKSSTGTLATSNDYKYTIKDAGYKTAYYHCTHTKTSDTLGGATITNDLNCSLE